MRQKLEFSKNLLEGLAMENYETIAKSAKALKLLSQAAEWEVPTIPNATDYVAFTTDFQRIADDLAKQAKAKNIDGATMAYMKLTMNCVECHKFVRFASH
jgi:cytochrome c556